MLQDFSNEETLNRFGELRKIEKEYIEVLEELETVRVENAAKTSTLTWLKNSRENALVLKQNAGLFNRLASFFHRGEYYETIKQVAKMEEKIKSAEEELKVSEEKEKEIKAVVEKLKNAKEAIILPEYVGEEDGKIVINDFGRTEKKVIGEDDKELLVETGIGIGEEESAKIGADKKVLVHCTNFFPTDNKILSTYDGERVFSAIETYHGVKKEVSKLSSRHEVHFTINNRVENTGDGKGNWDNPRYIVVDRLDLHENEMESSCASDSWTKGSSMELSADAVIMVRIQDKDKLPIPDEDKDKYNIIYYNGDATKCLRNFLELSGYQIFKTDANTAAHAKSNRMIQEKWEGLRNTAINFVKDNSYLSKDIPIFSEQDIASIIDVACYTTDETIIPGHLLSYYIGDKAISQEKREKYNQVISFIIGAGLKLNEDGKYTFKQPEEVFDDILSLDASIKDKSMPYKIPDCVDMELVDKCFELQQGVEQKHENAQLPTIEEFADMSLEDLYKFENQLSCEALQKTLPQNITLIGEKKGIRIRQYSYDNIGGKIRGNDNIEYEQLVADVGIISRIIDTSTLVSKVGENIENFEERIEQINSRNAKSYGMNR